MPSFVQFFCKKHALEAAAGHVLAHNHEGLAGRARSDEHDQIGVSVPCEHLKLVLQVLVLLAVQRESILERFERHVEPAPARLVYDAYLALSQPLFDHYLAWIDLPRFLQRVRVCVRILSVQAAALRYGAALTWNRK